MSCRHLSRNLTAKGWACFDCKELVEPYDPYFGRDPSIHDIPSIIEVRTDDGVPPNSEEK